MATRYWVNNGGNWIEGIFLGPSFHWSATSGGVGGASLPTSADDVIFDANSFTSSGQSALLFDTNSAGSAVFAKSITFSGVLHSPTIVFGQFGYAGTFVTLYGDLTLQSGMTIGNGFGSPGGVLFAGSGTMILTSAANNLHNLPINLQGSGTLRLNDNLPTTEVNIYEGTFDSNGHTVSFSSLQVLQGGGNVSITFDSGITMSNLALFTQDGIHSFTVSASTADVSFSGGIFILESNIDLTFRDLTIAPSQEVAFVGAQNFSFRDVTLATGNALFFDSGSQFTVTGTFTSVGAGNSLVPAGVLTVSVATASVSNLAVQNSRATGAAAPIDDTDGGTDLGNNEGWIFALAQDTIIF